MLEIAFQSAYSCSKSLLSVSRYSAFDPAERSSLLLLDKDILAVEGMIHIKAIM